MRSQTQKLPIAVIAVIFLLGASFSGILGQDEEAPSFHRDYVSMFAFSANKLVQLAEAIPEGKYDYAPAEGVRNVREAILHVVGGNYFIAQLSGTPFPDGINPQEMEKSIDNKADAIAALTASIEHVKAAAKAVSEEDLNTEVESPFGTFSKRQVLFILSGHVNEHLGQMIAYARANDVTPPWSAQQDGGGEDKGEESGE